MFDLLIILSLNKSYITKYQKLLLTPILALFVFVSTAQKQDGKQVEFNYIQSPLVKLDQTLTYDVKLTQTNKTEIQERKDAYEEKVRKAEESYASAMETWKNYTAAEKLLSKEPVKRNIAPYYIAKVFDEEMLAAQNIDISGFQKAESGDFHIDVKLHGFEVVSKEEKKTNESETALYYYKIIMKCPITLLVTDPDGNEVLNELLGPPTFDLNTEKFKTSGELRKYWRENEMSLKESYDETATVNRLKVANKFLNFHIGYPEESKRIKLYTAKNKKIDYSRLDEALVLAETAFLNFKDISDDTPKNKLIEAVTIWEDELTKADVKDKKAPINEIVASALYINAAYGQTILGNHQKAKDHFAQLKILKPARFLTYIYELEEFMEDFQKRNP